MKKSKKQKCAFDLLPFHVIEAFGQVHYCVDETLRQRLEAKLITKTLGFDTKSYVRKSNQ